jgi:hypothetical protein
MKPRYTMKRINGELVAIHRYLWEQVNGLIPKGMQIDHINGDIHDNRMSNLRLVTNQENARNRAVSMNNTSGVNGVSWCKKARKWRPSIGVDGKLLRLGTFDDWFEAVCARMSANNRYGFHVNHGRR